MVTEPAIYPALAAVMDDVKGVAKRDRNDHQRFMFRGIDAVVNAVGPALRKHGVIVTPTVDHVSYEVVSTSTGKPATACRLLVTYTFYAADGSSVAATVAGEAWDAGDKAAPKAMSVAFRTALLQALALPTDEADPDGQTYVRDHAPAPALSKGEQQRNLLLSKIGSAADQVGTSKSQIAEEWAAAHEGQVIADTTDLAGLQLLLDDLTTKAGDRVLVHAQEGSK